MTKAWSIIKAVDVNFEAITTWNKRLFLISQVYSGEVIVTMTHVIYFVLPVLSSIFGFVGE